ncbi:metabotropic glutamate receptor-like [Amphiura filiformis]|uniref:metabotropic glutamate receptor-like n=1 Tax=Amphiura filiformis TaxID=82378 RepID=UPI003B221C39
MAESMLFAVNKVNQRNDILPNVTLGVELRNDCSDEGLALWTTNTLVGSVGDLEYKDACPYQSRDGNRLGVQPIGIVGTSRSTTSLFAAKSSGVYHVPLVSYTATSDELSDAKRFPYFLRTVPPDKFQAIAIVDLLLHFHWEYIALFYSIDTYGIHGAKHIRTLAENAGICIAVNFPVASFDSESQTSDIVSKLQEANKVNVIVIMSYRNTANVVLQAMKESNLKDIILLLVVMDGEVMSKKMATLIQYTGVYLCVFTAALTKLFVSIMTNSQKTLQHPPNGIETF